MNEEDERAARLEQAKELIKAGKFEIGNEAANAGSDKVRAIAGHRPGCIIFQWSRSGVGFGELTLAVRDGKLHVDTESMGDEFCLDVLAQALREVEK